MSRLRRASTRVSRPRLALRRAARRWPTPSAGRTRPAAWAFSPWARTRTTRCSSSSRSALQQQFANNWLLSADGLHVFATRQIIGHLVRSTDSTSPDIACPGDNNPCTTHGPADGHLRQHHAAAVAGEVVVRRPASSAWRIGPRSWAASAISTTSATRFPRPSITPTTTSSPTTTPTSRWTWWRASTTCDWKRATR